MNEIKVLRTQYHQMSPTILDTFALGVKDGVFVLYPAKFPAPPMTQIIFEGIIEDFESARSAYVQGGDAQKGPYLDALAALMAALDEFADMVDGLPNLSVALILESGFTSTKETDTEHQIPDGSKGVVNLKRGDSTGVLIAECSVVPEAVYYHAAVSDRPLLSMRIDNNKTLVYDKTEAPLFVEVSKSRKKTFEGLTAGTVYYVYYFIGNARGVSHLTEVRSIMCA